MPHIITSVITNTGKTHQGNEVFDKCAASPTIRAEAHGNTPMVITVNNLHIAHNCGNALAMNCHEDGTSRTIKAQCARTSTANYLRTDSFGAGGVITIEKIGPCSD